MVAPVVNTVSVTVKLTVTLTVFFLKHEDVNRLTFSSLIKKIIDAR